MTKMPDPKLLFLLRNYGMVIELRALSFTVPSVAPVGVFCLECNATLSLIQDCLLEFTFTKYTPYSADGKGVLCPPCQQENKVPNNAGGGEAGDSPASKKRARAVKPKPVPLEKPKVQVKTLQNSCIHVSGYS